MSRIIQNFKTKEKIAVENITDRHLCHSVEHCIELGYIEVIPDQTAGERKPTKIQIKTAGESHEGSGI